MKLFSRLHFRRRDFAVLVGMTLLAAPFASRPAHGLQTAKAEPTVPDAVLKVENGGLLFTDNNAGVSGTDAGYSLAIGGQTLWLFGDVFLLSGSPARNYVGGVSNCALLVPKGTGTAPLRRYTFLTDAQTGLARQVLPNLAGEDNHIRLWPFGSWYDDAQQRACLYYARIRTTGGGPFDFKVEGYGLATAETRRAADLQFRRVSSAGRELWWTGEGEKSVFGSAVAANTPGDWVYVVGVQEREKLKRGKLARVRKTQITDLNAYEYWAGNEDAPQWSRKVEDAADVAGLTDFPTELSLSYNPHLRGWLAIHSVGVSERLRLCLALHPWGPYKTIAEIGAPHQAFAQSFCYAGKEHPELAEQNGRIVYITYVDSQRYWLSLLKVTLR